MAKLEVRDIVATGDFLSGHRDTLSVLWTITNGCTYRCSYCFYSKDNKLSSFSNKSDLLRAARTLLRLGRPGYQITLYGGEPTYHPHFQDLVEYLAASQAPISLRVITNGSRSPDFFERLTSSTPVDHLGLIFSLHAEFAKFSKFKRLIEVTSSSGAAVGISVMYDARTSAITRRYLLDLLVLRMRYPFFVTINLPYDETGALGPGCTREDLETVAAFRRRFAQIPIPSHLHSPFFTRIQSDVIVQREGRREAVPRRDTLQLLAEAYTPSYREFYCCAGANVIFVHEDGSTIGGVCSNSRYIGNLMRDSETSIIRNMRVVCCDAVACSSIENIPLPKFRNRAEADACMDAFKQRAAAYLYRAEASRIGCA